MDLSDFSTSHITVGDDDLMPAQLTTVAVTTWHSTLGFCDKIPVELENLCREIEATGVSGAMHKEVVMGRYVYWNWKLDWTIVAGLPSTYQDKNDLLLFRTRRNDKLPPSYD